MKDITFEDKLWKAADKLRKKVEVHEYKYIVLGLLFLRADDTGFGFGNKSLTPVTPKLNWKRGTQIRTVQSHVRLEVIRAVDENNYESEIEMLRKALKKLEPQKGLPFIADKGYGAIESLLDRGFEPAIRIKETMRMSIKHPLRKLSNESWERYGKMRYRVEQA